MKKLESLNSSKFEKIENLKEIVGGSDAPMDTLVMTGCGCDDGYTDDPDY